MTAPTKRRPLGRKLAGVAVVVLAVLGAVLLGVGLSSQQHAPQPSAAAASPAAAPSTATAPTGAAQPQMPQMGLVLPRSLPLALALPSIGVRSDLLALGLNPDHTVQVPPLGPVSQAGWYQQSPTPGQVGPAILLGHIDSARYGPGVFFKLGALKPGDPVEVTRTDHTVAVFRVDRVVSYPKASFPSLEVYGNTPDAQLRLITCGGVFDPAARSYESNIVAFAGLLSTRPA
jgi:Sortase domain